MHTKIIAHNAKANTSSSSIVEYLEKENVAIKDSDIILKENFFNSDIDLNDVNKNLSTKEVINSLDSNLGTQKKSASNYFMLNISPSNKELLHIEKIAEAELKEKGILEKNNKAFYDLQKDFLVRAQLKLYTKNVMENYASCFNREVYVDQDNLPNKEEDAIINKEADFLYDEFLKSKNIELIKDDVLKLNIKIDSFEEKEKGGIFNIYSENLKRIVPIYLSNSEYENVLNNNVVVNKNIYEERLFLKEEDVKRNESLIAIENQKESFIKKGRVFEKNNLLSMEVKILNVDKPIQIMFDKKNLTFENGTFSIKKSVYEKELEKAKIKEYKKLYIKDFEDIYKYNFGSVKSKNTDLSDKETKKIDIQTSIDFKKLLIQKELLSPELVKDEIDLKNRINIEDFEILQESTKAKLIEFNHDSFIEPLKIWVPNYYIKEDNNILSLPKEFVNLKLKEIENLKNEENIIIKDYKEISFYRENLKINKDCISSEIDIKGLSKSIVLNFDKDNLINDNGIYKIDNESYSIIKEHEIIKQAKIDYEKEYLKLKNKLIKENPDKSQDKLLKSEFKKFLITKDILKSKNDILIFEKENYSIGKTTNKITEVNLKIENKDIKIFIPKSDISIVDNNLKIDTKDINYKINKAVKSFDKKNELVKIDFDSSELIPKKGKDNLVYESIQFNIKNENLKETIKLQFKSDEVKKIDNDFYIEKYKIDYKMKTTINSLIDNKYGNEREEIYNKIATSKGFNMEKRALSEKDLLWYAKVEKNRTYKPQDIPVIANQRILKEMEKVKVNSLKYLLLKKSLHREKETGKVIMAGMNKEGKNYHVHVLVSRHDKTNKDPKKKLSLSPLANAIDSKMNNNSRNARVGFNRKLFFEKNEKTFDEKFDYQRNDYEKFTKRNEIVNKAKGKVISTIKNYAGINQLQNQINPINKIKQEIPMITTIQQLPTNVYDAVFKVAKNILSQGSDLGF